MINLSQNLLIWNLHSIEETGNLFSQQIDG